MFAVNKKTTAVKVNKAFTFIFITTLSTLPVWRRILYCATALHEFEFTLFAQTDKENFIRRWQ